MHRRPPADDDWDESENEFDSSYADDDEPQIDCPYCGEPILEIVLQCPHCHQYLSTEDSSPARKPLWIILGTVVCLLIVVIELIYQCLF